MTGTRIKPRLTSLAPQLLVDDLERSITYYETLGFVFGEPWDGFYAIGKLDGLELHLKEGPRTTTSANTGMRRTSGCCGRGKRYARKAVHPWQVKRNYDRFIER